MLMNLEISIQKYNYKGFQAYRVESVETVVFWLLEPWMFLCRYWLF